MKFIVAPRICSGPGTGGVGEGVMLGEGVRDGEGVGVVLGRGVAVGVIEAETGGETDGGRVCGGVGTGVGVAKLSL